jgi:hypothetical protein
MTAMTSAVPPDLHAAFSRARKVAEQHMVGCERDGSSWREETVSELIWQAARPYATYADFTRRQESAIGADWLWWWIDETEECFGMLVQAKRLHRRNDRWVIDFQRDGGAQMAQLFRTAQTFDVPAIYVLYLGSAGYRAGAGCGPSHAMDCDRCQKATVSVMAGLNVELAGPSPIDGASEALRIAIPLEDLADPSSGIDQILDLNLRSADPELREFLLQGQTGARHIARTIFNRVSTERRGQFTSVLERQTHTEGNALFRNLPLDAGHYRAPYFPHVLRGLRAEPPEYVRDMLVGREAPDWVTDQVGGIVIIRC